jgi:acetylornithine deacetylase/succinyl-diaminopimelate desuccinylase-like protein
MSQLINSYIQTNKDRFIDELFGLLRIPSISSSSEHKVYMIQTAEFIKEKLTDAGAEKAKLIPTKGYPVVYAEKIINPNYPTVLVYGHYDVQPIDPIELWKNPPFEPVIIDDKIYARGADDDKGQMYMQVKAFELLNKNKLLKCNVKFMIEGEEEIGSEHLGDFCKENKELLKADIILVSDTGMFSVENPAITVGLRGISYMEVEVTGPNRDLHSGHYGGAVANPINILCNMITKLHDDNNKIAIPGFYDDVLVLSAEERKEYAKIPFNLENFKKEINIPGIKGEKDFTTLERIGTRPALDVNGIWGGHTGEGSKTVIPSKAYAKISMRLVPNQKAEKIAELFENYFKSIAPEAVNVKVRYLHGGNPFLSPTNTKAYIAASKAYEEVFGKKPLGVRGGGSIPIINLFEEVLGIKSILMGFGLESDAIHSPNENYPVNNFLKGIETIAAFYNYYTES